MINIPLSILAESIPRAGLSGRPDVLVQRITADSRHVRPGDVFACIRGRHQDGHKFAAHAVRQGAAAVMLEKHIPGLDTLKIGIIKVPRVSRALKKIAPHFYNLPSLKFKVVGITGTNGKTTVNYFLRSILESGRPPQRVGLIGTIRHELPGYSVAALNTTPMAWELQSLLFKMAAKQCDVALMEVSSHALAEERVAGCEFDVAVFTNLTPEHLDFHGTLENYAAAKRRLFTQLAEQGYKSGPKYAVINRDDPQSRGMMRAAGRARIKTYGLQKAAEFTAQQMQIKASGSAFRLITPQGRIRVQLKLAGQHNVLNALAAAATAQCLGVSLPGIQKGLEAVSGVPGRMENISGSGSFNVIVDYAHTPDGLSQVLQAARKFTSRKIIVIFGCGGDRDTSKRPAMGEIAAELADVVVITSDNPRSEDPEKIIRDIVAGAGKSKPRGRSKRSIPENNILIEIDRTRAIRAALRLAGREDTVLIAGKGHENYQILAHQTIPFDDRRIVRQELARLNRRGKCKV